MDRVSPDSVNANEQVFCDNQSQNVQNRINSDEPQKQTIEQEIASSIQQQQTTIEYEEQKVTNQQNQASNSNEQIKSTFLLNENANSTNPNVQQNHVTNSNQLIRPSLLIKRTETGSSLDQEKQLFAINQSSAIEITNQTNSTDSPEPDKQMFKIALKQASNSSKKIKPVFSNKQMVLRSSFRSNQQVISIKPSDIDQNFNLVPVNNLAKPSTVIKQIQPSNSAKNEYSVKQNQIVNCMENKPSIHLNLAANSTIKECQAVNSTNTKSSVKQNKTVNEHKLIPVLFDKQNGTVMKLKNRSTKSINPGTSVEHNLDSIKTPANSIDLNQFVNSLSHNEDGLNVNKKCQNETSFSIEQNLAGNSIDHQSVHSISQTQDIKPLKKKFILVKQDEVVKFIKQHQIAIPNKQYQALVKKNKANHVKQKKFINKIKQIQTTNLFEQNQVQSLIQQNQSISPIKQNQIKPNQSPIKFKQVANIINPNQIMNPINQNNVMIPISKNKVMIPISKNQVVSPVTPNQVVGPIKENQVVSPIKENQVVSPIKKNQVVHFVKQNPNEISPVKQKQAFIKPIQASLPLKYNKAINIIKQNLTVSPIKLKQAHNSIEQNQAIHYVTQNQTVSPIKQNAIVVSPIQQKQTENIKQVQSVSPIKEMQIVSPIKQNQPGFIKPNKVVTPIKKIPSVSPIKQAVNLIEEKWALTFSKEDQVATSNRHIHAVNKSFNPINRNQSLIDQHQANEAVNSMKLNQIDSPIKQSQVVSPIKQTIIQSQVLQNVNLNPVNQYQVFSPVKQNQVNSFKQQVSEENQTINRIMQKQSVSPIKQNQAVNPTKQKQATNFINQSIPQLYGNNGKPVKLRNLTAKFIKPKSQITFNQNKATSFINQNSIGKKVASEINQNRTANVIKKNEHAISFHQNALTHSKKQPINQKLTANSKALNPVNKNLSNEKIDNISSNEQPKDISSTTHIEDVNSMKENLDINSKNSIEHNQTVNSIKSSINECEQLANTISQILAANYANKQDIVGSVTNNDNGFSNNESEDASCIKQNKDVGSIQQIENNSSIDPCNDVGAIVEISDGSSFEQIGEVSAVEQSSTQQNLDWNNRIERERLANTIGKILAEHGLEKPLLSAEKVSPVSSSENNAVANLIKPAISEQKGTISQNQNATSSVVDACSTKELYSKKQDETVTSTKQVAKSTRKAGIRNQQNRPVFYKKRYKNTSQTAMKFFSNMSALSSSTQEFVNSFMQNMTVNNDDDATEEVETIRTMKTVAMNFNKPGCSNEGDETTSRSRGAGFRKNGNQSRGDTTHFMQDVSEESLNLAMEMATLGMNSQYMQNPFLQNLSSLLYANPGGPSPWGPALSNKAVSSMWMNADSKQMGQPHQEEEEVDDEEMGVAETYEDYMPSKLKLGRKHPDPVVETASLSSVAPADVWYTLSIPEDTIKGGHLSALQLESITYASQAHEHILPDGSRAGFLIGDGAGVGKGRTIAGVIYENYLKGRKRAIWVSVSNDLKYDAERDLKDIGAGKVEVHALNKFKYAKISSAINNNVKKGVVFSTYSALIGESNSAGGKYKTRLKQLLQWCGPDFDGLIIFDECHRAKNLCPVGSSKPTKTGLTVLELQNKLPKARVVYASATGASEPRNMAYMVRLGMWGEGSPFKEFNDFISAVEKRGVGAMEIVAMDMKLRGMYIARQLSFHGVSFKIEEVPLPKEFERIYDASVKLWVEAMQKFHEAAELIDAENRMRKTMWGQFWSSHQRFFKYLCIAAKVPHAVATAHEAIKMGKCVVIGLQSTGEARTLEQLERDDGELTDFVSTAKGVFQTLVEKHFPAPDRNRIQRLLGIEAPTNAKKSTNGNDEGHTSSGKRKPVRQAAARAVKRNKWSTSDSDKSDSERSSAGSEFKMTDGESEISEERSDSAQSSDFNPFNSDSDSDNDPWSRNKKKGKKVKKVKKKRPSTTQDKISLLLVQKTQKSKSNGGHMNNTPSYAPPRDAIERAITMKEELLRQIERLGDKLPPNTLDQLIDELGGPENVAEMTGRKGRVVQTEDGIQYESRSEADVPLETLNLTEKQRFMDGEKDVAIISEAASSGISLQSDRRVRNQRRRVHITLELPWSADRAIQQFGRTHRSNQVNAPEYIFLISDLAGERRFASIVAKRLESLGALTHGDRRATETRDLSQFNIDNKYGRTALETTMKTIMGYESPLVPPPQDYKGDFFKDAAAALVGVGLIVNSESMPGVLSLDKDYNNMSKFLNRILGMPVDLQNRLFRYFTDTLAEIITQAKRSGRFDLGILDLGAGGENVKRVKTVTFLRKHATGTAPTELHTVHVERGMSWAEVIEKWADLAGTKEGFYLSHQVRNNKHTAILAVCVDSGNKKKSESKKEQMYFVYRPNTGLQFRQESLAELEKKYKKVQSDEAQEAWNSQYDSSLTTCSHAYWRGNCRNVNLGHDCEVGLRRRTYHVVSGSVLSVWARVEGVLASRNGSHNNKMQVIRLRTDDGLKIVGTLIPKNCVESLIEALSADAEKVEEKTF